jgi:hypothetical protein
MSESSHIELLIWYVVTMISLFAMYLYDMVSIHLKTRICFAMVICATWLTAPITRFSMAFDRNKIKLFKCSRMWVIFREMKRRYERRISQMFGSKSAHNIMKYIFGDMVTFAFIAWKLVAIDQQWLKCLPCRKYFGNLEKSILMFSGVHTTI